MSPDKRDREEPRSEGRHTPDDLARLAASLGQLSPRASSLASSGVRTDQPSFDQTSRDRLMYQAGHAAAIAELQQPAPALPRWTWPTTSVVSTLVAILFVALWIAEANEPQVVEKIVYVNQNDEQVSPDLDAVASSPKSKADARVGPAESVEESDFSLNTFRSIPLAARQRARQLKFDESAPYNYLALRDRALWFGVDSLPQPQRLDTDDVEPSASRNRQEMLQELLHPQTRHKANSETSTPDMSRFNSNDKRTA